MVISPVQTNTLRLVLCELRKEVWVGDVSFCIPIDVEDGLGCRFEVLQHRIVFLCKGKRGKAQRYMKKKQKLRNSAGVSRREAG